MTGDETRGEAEVWVSLCSRCGPAIQHLLAERDRARDAEARRVVERAVSALIATGRHTTETAHAALAEIEEG